MSRLRTALALLLLAAATAAVPAQATQPQAQRIDLVGQVAGPDTVSGTWTATGLVNDGGTYVETFRFAGQTIHAEQVLVGSKGTIVLRAQAVAEWLSACTVTFRAGSWQIVEGSGAYARLKGGGAPAVDPGGFGDICTGEVRGTHTGGAHLD